MLSQILKSTWPLFLAVSFLMLGNGLQGTLIGWRGTHEGFAGSTMGIIMAGYYIGFMMGSKFVQPVVIKVGHIRAFAALASIASTAILMQIVVISEPVWFAMRMLTGFCFAGSYVVIESWLNERANNVTRGSLFSIYMVVSFASMTAGQWLFDLGDPAGYKLFIVASVLLSLSLVPLLISDTETPDVQDAGSMKLRQLYRICPAGISSLFLVGIAQGIMFTMGVVYARLAGMSTTQIAYFMSIMIAAGAISQWPLGKLSDVLDRRVVIMVASALAVLACIALLRLVPGSNAFILIYGIFGALNLPLYSLAVAHTNDRLEPEQMVGASSTLVFTFGLGSIIGPLSMGFMFDFAGANSYFIYLGLLHAMLVLVTFIYVSRRKRVVEDKQVHYHVTPASSSAIAMEAIALSMEEEMALEDELADESR